MPRPPSQELLNRVMSPIVKKDMKKTTTPSKRPLLVNKLGKACEHFQHPFRLIVSGRSTMGKTTLSVDIILAHIIKQVRRCFAACPTFWDQPALARFRSIPGAFTKKTVFTQVDDNVFEFIYQQLKRNPAPTLLFVDDAAAEAATNKGNKGAFSRLCLAAPHLNLTIIGCFQRLTAASPAFRDNAEGLISFTPTKLMDVDTIVKEFNPCPAKKNSKEICSKALQYAWDEHMYALIWRMKRGPVIFYSGLDSVIAFDS